MSKIWKNIIAQTQEEVKATFQELYASVDFGAYIAPQDYFVSYIFKTEEELSKGNRLTAKDKRISPKTIT